MIVVSEMVKLSKDDLHYLDSEFRYCWYLIGKRKFWKIDFYKHSQKYGRG